MTRLPGAYEEETEALRFLDGFGTPPCPWEPLLCGGAERHGTGGRQGGHLLPAPRRGWKHGAEPAVESQSQERKGWLCGCLGGCCELGGRQGGSAWPKVAVGHRDMLHVGRPLSQSRGSSCALQHPPLCACVAGGQRGRLGEVGAALGPSAAASAPCPLAGRGLTGLGAAGAELGAAPTSQPAARVPPQCLAGARPARSIHLGFRAVTLQPPLPPPRVSPLPPAPAGAPRAPGALLLLGARAAAPLRIHLLLLNRLPQALGRARRGTSTLRLCQRHLGPCRPPPPSPSPCWDWGH